MQLGLCAHPEDLAAFTELPFDFIEGHVQNFLKPEAPAPEFAANAAAMRTSPRPMPSANCFLPASLKVTGPSVDAQRLATYAETAFARARSIGLSVVVFGSAGARQVPEGWSPARGFEQYVEALKIVGPIAVKHGVTVVVEPLNRGECNLVNTIDEGAEAVRRCGHAGVRLLVDLFHMLRNGEAPDAIARHADLVVHSHVAENENRAAPGTRNEDFRPFLRALKKAVRCQRLAIECVWTEPMAAAAPAAFAALRRQLAEAGY
ncbi:MAG TPA: sugar phosphate isomerase/epimerase family protein [Opitutaceae bacterium]|nr:sugar phosphate isomerase/epimerase family protein [Opitutaceae bacterium]